MAFIDNIRDKNLPWNAFKINLCIHGHATRSTTSINSDTNT